MRIDDIHSFVKNYTRNLIETDSLNSNGVDAQMAASGLKLDRANVSKDLNKLWKNGKLIKVVERPVLYLDYLTVINYYNLDFVPITIEKNDLITNHIANFDEIMNENSPQQNLSIGTDGSLLDQMNKVKAALSYPPHGLNTVLIGETGVGKSYLCREAFNYTVQNSFKDESSKFITIECQNFSLDNNLFDLQLYGASKGAIPLAANKYLKGSIENSNKGVVYLNNADKLNPVSLNILLEVIKTGKFSRIGESKPRNLDATLILAANSNSAEINHLKQYVTNVISIPNIDDRNIAEKIEFILHFFCIEAINTKLSITLTKDILFCLATFHYENNLTQMHSEITQICARSYLTTINNKLPNINVNLNDLPVAMLEEKNINRKDVDKVHRLLQLVNTKKIRINADGTCSVLDFFRNEYSATGQNILNQFVNEFSVNLDSLDSTNDFIAENLYCLSNCGKSQIDSLQNAINPIVFRIFLMIMQKYRYRDEILNNKKLTYGLVLHLSNLIKRKEKKEISKGTYVTEKIYPEEFVIATRLISKLEEEFKIRISDRETDFAASYIAITHHWINQTKVSLLIITHGDNIATGLMKNIQPYITKDLAVKAIDFHENMQLNDLMELALLNAKEINKGAGVIVAYDIEPLYSISNHIMTSEHIKSRSVANINLSSLLELTDKINSNMTIEQIISVNSPHQKKNQSDNSYFINELVKNFIEPNLVFLDAKKAVDNLFISLSNILMDLSLPYSKEVGVKFLTHTVHMLERVIKKEPLSYVKLKQFLNENKELHYSVEKNLVNINELYGIFIPPDEIAFIMEIFLYL